MPQAKAQVNADNVILTGRYALSADDYLTAIRLFSMVIESKPHLQAPYYYRAYAKFSLEDYLGAETDCSRAIERNPYIPETYLLRALCRIHNDNFEGAIQDYDHALADRPDDADARHNRALCHMELRHDSLALHDLDSLMWLRPKDHRPLLLKAQIAFQQGDSLLAMARVDSLIALQPQTAAAWSFKGKYALQTGNCQLADSCLSKAIALAPGDHENYMARAQARHILGKFGGALDDYDQTIKLVPQHFVAHYNRGLLRALLGNHNQAIEDFDFVLLLEPDNTLARYNRALLRESTGDYKGSIADYDLLLQAYPNFIAGYQARAALRRKTGDKQGALADETKVARAGWDLFYRPRKRMPVKKVRQRSEHSLETYQQLIEAPTDSSRRYANEWFGPVQNRPADLTPLPPYLVCTDNPSPHPETGMGTAEIHLPLLDSLKLCAPIARKLHVSLPATNTPILPTAWLPSGTGPVERLEASAHYAASGQYAPAMDEVNQALAQIEPKSNDHASLRICMRLLLLQQSALGKLYTTSADTLHENPMQAALQASDRLLRELPGLAVAHYNRGCLLMDIGNEEEAEAAFIRTLEQDSLMAAAHYNLGLLYLKTGRNQKALPHLSKAGELGIPNAYPLLKAARRKEKGEGNR